MSTRAIVWVVIVVIILAAVGAFYHYIAKGILVGYGPSEIPAEGVAGISVPEGFKIEFYTKETPNARSIVYDNENLYVGSMGAGNVYAVSGVPGNTTVEIIASGLKKPNGVAVKDHTMYVTTTSQVIRYNKATGMWDGGAIKSHLPSAENEHDWRYTAFGPDGKLYIGMGSPCNVCDAEDPYSTIARINDDGTNFEVYARGIRNTVGFDWNKDGTLWFTDNGRDWLGDENPPDELNQAPQANMHFGFPYCHGKNNTDPDFPQENACDKYTPPEVELGPHVAALGMEFYEGKMFPAYYQEGIFVAEHGSWNRQTPIGYRVMFVPFENGKPTGYEVFAQGWLNGSSAWGRPVDIETLPDGSILISDDKAGAIYRITYEK